MMDNFFRGVIATVALCGIGLAGYLSVQPDIELLPTCEEMYQYNWSFQQCLKHGATCANEISMEAFGVYHQNRHALDIRCDDQPGTELPETSIKLPRKN